MPQVASNAPILIVDDDRFQRELLSHQLEALGWNHVLVAESGDAALQLLDARQSDICLIISDLSMPDMDGLVLMRHFAQRQVQAALILISGVSDEILNSAAGLASAHGLHLLGVLSKPSSSETLANLLAKVNAPTRKHHALQDASLSPERLRQALEKSEFVPWYQPKVNARSGAVEAVEALARWPRPQGPSVGPGQFIPAIEDAGLADTLFYAIARQTVAAVRQWHAMGLPLKAAINLSMDSALNLDLPERLLKLVQDGGMSPEHFIIEVTESRLMVERSLAMESLTRLSLMGFKLSIDDFGTGYSSLVQLIDLPFRELKIDGSFVQRASLEDKAQTILRISALLGNNLNMEVTAEGVETADQLERVRDCGCSTVQGYFFAAPMPLEACTHWLLEQQRKSA